jgi:hypothetical protein
MPLSLDERIDALTALQRCAAARRGTRLPPDRAEALVELLADLDWVDLASAIETCAQRDRFFPDLPSIRSAALAQQAARRRRIPPAVAAALAEGEIACRDCEDTGWRRSTRRAPIYGEEATVVCVSPCRCHPAHPDHRPNPIYEARRRYVPRGGAREAHDDRA